ncbi:MAG: fibronectin type III domain-containing protein, partial [Bacteroidia bacterium]
MKYLYLSLSLLLAAPVVTQAQSSKEYSVPVSADVQKNAPKITLQWTADVNSTGYKIWRKAKTATTWGTVLASLPGTATTYTDNTTTEGQAYEYRLEKTAMLSGTPYTGNGYIYAGAKIPAIENRDKIILLVDNDFTTDLATEIKRLEMDLIGDGWQVIRRNVKKTDKVKDVKKIIMQDYNADPTHVKALFLLGHIPVPYSGNYAIDHHIPDHMGAWPADVYYGSMDDNAWTDYEVDNDVADRTENDNIPADGKFDNDIIPSDLKLQIGRVDFYNLPAFTTSETELMRRYLNKDHNWRTKAFTAKEKGLIEDNFGGMNGEAFAAVGFYNFAAMFGDSNVFVKDYLKSLASDTFLWSYGTGGGSYTSVSGVASTNDFVTKKVNSVFTALFGSYSGDWDSKDNILRAALAGDNMVLGSVWAGRPHWNFHHMALGENIGYSTHLTQNDYVNYFRIKTGYAAPLQNTGDRLTTPALMGDPTIRMHVVA